MNKAIGGNLPPVLLACQTVSFVGGVEVTGGRQARPRSMVLLGNPSTEKGEDPERGHNFIESILSIIQLLSLLLNSEQPYPFNGH